MADIKLTKEDKLTREVANLFNTISYEDVLFREKDGKWFLGKIELTEAQKKQYAEEAAIMKNLYVWKEIEKCIKYLTNRKMFLESKTVEDLIGGKLVLFTLKNINTILDTAIKLSQK